VSVHELDPARWHTVGVPDDDGHERLWIFQGPNADAIMDVTVPLLVGEIRPTAPAFVMDNGGTLGRRFTILLLPLERR
jgi:hypothetical protein